MTLFALRNRERPGADVVIRNGFPAKQDALLADGDAIVFIRRGEIPGPNEMEALLVSRHTPGVHARVKAARVGIAGLGGLGSAVAITLARVGVGALVLADFDVVEPSNLNRQQYFIDQVGMKKTEALAANLRRVNPYVAIEMRDLVLTRQNIPEVFAGCDALAECFDDPHAKREMTLAVRKAMPGVPLVTVSGLAGHGPASAIGVRRIFNDIYLVGDRESAAQPGRGLMAPRVAVAAGHQANLIFRLLLGENIDEDVN
jgi:sulfur carrier protein ThiS adenylyltransferase